MRLTTLFFMCCLLAFITGKVSAQNVIPPQPLYPGNGEMIREKLPSFAWSPSNGNLKGYLFKLVEVLLDQTPEVAILANPVLLEVNNLTTVLPYPVYAPALERGKKYAWQITTEALTFVGEQQVTVLIPGEVYLFSLAPLVEEKCLPLLAENVEKRFYLIENYNLKFGFQETALLTRRDFTYQILEENSQSPVLSPVTPSWNEEAACWSVPLKEFGIFRKAATRNKFYILKAISPAGDTYQLKFTCQ
jgi:hypothetical protein